MSDKGKEEVPQKAEDNQNNGLIKDESVTLLKGAPTVIKPEEPDNNKTKYKLDEEDPAKEADASSKPSKI